MHQVVQTQAHKVQHYVSTYGGGGGGVGGGTGKTQQAEVSGIVYIKSSLKLGAIDIENYFGNELFILMV